jgi:hypothetical protein
LVRVRPCSRPLAGNHALQARPGQGLVSGGAEDVLVPDYQHEVRRLARGRRQRAGGAVHERGPLLAGTWLKLCDFA